MPPSEASSVYGEPQSDVSGNNLRLSWAGDNPGDGVPLPSCGKQERNKILDAAMLLFDGDPSLHSLHELFQDDPPSKTS